MNLLLIVGAFLSLAGILLLVLGILFVIAADGLASRLATGALLCAAGIASFTAGIRLFKKGLAGTRRGIRNGILSLARQKNGRVTRDMITAELGDTPQVSFHVEEMVRQGLAEKTMEGAGEIFIFRDFNTSLMVRQCPYCGNDYPLRENIEKCPSCGGDLKMKKSATDRDDLFGMDR